MTQKAVIYERQASVRRQDNCLSDNLRACEALAARHGLEIIDRFIDEGIGGHTHERPALCALLDFLEREPQPVTVITSDQQRIARNMKLRFELHDRISKTDAILITPERKRT